VRSGTPLALRNFIMGDAKEALFEAIGKQPWLEATSEPVAKAIRSAFPGEAGGRVKDALHGTWLGHPLHPVLTDIPVGAWTTAMVLDALESLSGNDGIGAGADAAIAVGLAGAVGAAITGATDFSESDGRGRTIGLLHGMLNVVATTLYATSLFMRKEKKSRAKGVAVSMLGYAVASASAYLGGHLVFGEQLGVDHTATPDATQPRDFTPVLAAAALAENVPTRVNVENTAVVLVKRTGRIYALSATCPHLGGPLDEGELIGGAIRCPWHGSELALEDGHVVKGPTTFPARCYDVRVREGNIEIRSGSKQAVTAGNP
jgi:nitrite reductase/ring-hydroxylating ferredoxin subunit/uncharacterized membrane protein